MLLQTLGPENVINPLFLTSTVVTVLFQRSIRYFTKMTMTMAKKPDGNSDLA
jgi:hypothetical protein